MQRFIKTLTKEDFSLVDTQVFSGKYNEVCRLRVPAQNVIYWGAGAVMDGVDLREPIQIVFKDSNGNEIRGWVRIKVHDANDVRTVTLLEDRSEKFSIPPTDRINAYKLGIMKPGAKEDSYLVIEIKPDQDATISAQNSVLNIPVTVVNL
ncbi:MAG TPA: hypothetical protein EYH56_03850 [Nanoarchaeota archaeon]|nr:hypothetical protein [Nanoarchaeota archaeon]